MDIISLKYYIVSMEMKTRTLIKPVLAAKKRQLAEKLCDAVDATVNGDITEKQLFRIAELIEEELIKLG